MDIKFEISTSKYTKTDNLRILNSWKYPRFYNFTIFLFALLWTDLGRALYISIMFYQKIMPKTIFYIIIGLFLHLYMFKQAEIRYFILTKIRPKIIKNKEEMFPKEIRIYFFEDISIFLGRRKVENNYNTLLRCEFSSKDFLLMFKKMRY